MKRVLVVVAVLFAGCGQDGAFAVHWRWVAPAPAYVGAPAIEGDDLAATYGHAALVMIDGRGRPRWRTVRVGLRDVAPAFAGDVIVAATDDGLAAFARSDGRLRWERALGDRPSAPIVREGVIVVTTWEGRLIAVDRWAIVLPGASLGPPAAAGRTVVASWDSGVLGASLDTGAVLWQHDFAEVGTSGPVVAAGVAVVIGGDRRARAFDLATGRERWSFPTVGAGSPEAPPAVHGRRVALSDRLGHLVVVDAATGRIRWRADGGGAVERSGPVFADGGTAVVLPLDDGRLLVAAEGRRNVLDPPGRVSGVAARRDTVIYATREARTNGLTALAI